MEQGVDLLLINPGDTKKVYQGLSDEFSAIEPPVSCAMFADYVRIKGYSVSILDVPALGLTSEEAARVALEYNPVLIGVVVYGFQPSASTQNMPSAGEICRHIREKNPTQHILFTGTHPAALPERTLKEECADFVCTGEGPVTLLSLLQALKGNETDYSKVPGLCYWKEDKVCITFPSPLVRRLDVDFPSIAWDLLPMEKYRAHNWHCFDGIERRQPYVSLHTSLGCPYQCVFCCINTPFSGPAYSQQGPTYRMWSPDWVIAQIDLLVTRYGIRNIKIIDEMFVLNKAHVLGICERIIDRGYDLNIWAYGRIDTVKEEFLEQLRKAGFRWLAIGIESGSEHVREGADKDFKHHDIVGVVRKIQAAGIYVGANYIFGLPDDTQETMRDTFDLATQINSEWANFYSAMAYPGSPLYKMAKEGNLALPDNPGGPGWIGYSQHSYETMPLPTNTLGGAEVLRMRDNAFMNYFTNPQYLNMVESMFGRATVVPLQKMTSTPPLKRKLLGD